MTDAKLKSLAERIERLMDEKDGIGADIRDIYTEAKSAGYVPKVLRKAITRKRMDPSKRNEEDAILELYEGALDGKTRRAVSMAAQGATARQIEAETGIDQATVARAVSLKKRRETKKDEITPPVEMGAQAQPEHAPPSQGDSGECLSGRVLESDEHSTPAARADFATGDHAHEGEVDAPINLRVSEADGRSTRADGSGPRGSEDLQRRAGCGAPGWPGQDLRDPRSPIECDVGERGDHPPAGRDAADVALPAPEVVRVAPPAIAAKRELAIAHAMTRDAMRGMEEAMLKSQGLGAVAEPSAAQHVAPNNPDDGDLTIPHFLRRVSA